MERLRVCCCRKAVGYEPIVRRKPQTTNLQPLLRVPSCSSWIIMSSRTFAGTPTASDFGGTSLTTTALAPITLSWPTRHGPEDRDAAADVDAVFDGRELVQRVLAGDAEGRVLADVDVVADRFGVEDHPAVVPDPHPPAEPDGVRQGDPAGPLDPLEQEPVQQRAAAAGAAWSAPSASCRTGGRRPPRTPARRGCRRGCGGLRAAARESPIPAGFRFARRPAAPAADAGSAAARLRSGRDWRGRSRSLRSRQREDHHGSRSASHQETVPHEIPQQARRVAVGLALEELPQAVGREADGPRQVGQGGLHRAVVDEEVPPAAVEPVFRAAAVGTASCR